jgi:Major Facilitator Superfamily
MLPAALSIVMNMFAEGAERNKALGIWGGLGAGGATVGVIAGGLLTRYAGWQYIFYLNVPIGAVALLLAPRIVPESRLDTMRRKFDAAGALAGTGGLVLLVDAISQAPQYGWGATRTVAGARRGRRASDPLLGRRAPGRGADPSAVDLPAAHALGRERRRAAARGQLLRVHLRRHPVHAAGSALQRAADRHRLAASLTSIAVEEHRAGLASGLLNSSQQLGGAIGIAIASSVAAGHTQALLHAGSHSPAALTGGFQQAFWVLGAIGLLAIPAILALVRRNDLSDAVTKTIVGEPRPAVAASS